jgi:CHAT domain-containing protein/tetratricopeptide (TPR) repeat protein
VLNNIGIVYDNLGEHQKAIDFYKQALPILRAVGDRGGEGTTLHNIGLVHRSLGEPQKALDYLGQGLTLRRSVGDRAGEAQTLDSIGAVYNLLGEKQKALDFFNRVLPLRRAVGDHRGEAYTLTHIGFVYDSLGEKQKALDYYGQALPLRRLVGDRNGEADTLNVIGILYSTLGEKQKALDFFDRALTLWRTVGDRSNEAQALNNIGYVYDSLGEKQKALAYYNQSLPLRRVVGDRFGEAYTLNNIGKLHDELGDRQKALDLYNQALSLRRDVGDRAGEAQTLNNIGRLYASSGDQQKALDYYNQALPLSQAVGDRRTEAATLSNIARVEINHGALPEARGHTEAALNIIESLRTKVVSQELRASYVALVENYYESHIDVLMRLHQLHPTVGFDTLALQSSERARARSLLETLTETRAEIRQGVDSALLARERSLQQLLGAKADRQMRILNGKHSEDQAAAAAKEIEALTTEYQEVKTRIRQGSPRYAALTQPQPLNASEIQQQVLDNDTLLLEYSLGDEHSYLWAINPTSMTSFELPKRSVIERAARHLYDLLTARVQQVEGESPARRKVRVAQADAAYPAAAVSLSQMLLAPIAAELGRRLLIVSDGALQYIPFAVLPEPTLNGRAGAVTRGRATIVLRSKTSRKPLMVDHEIVSLPSASTLAVLRRELAGRSIAPKTAAVFADPVFEPTDLRVKRSVAVVEQKPGADLPVTEQHVSLNELSRTRSLLDSGVTGDGRSIPRLPYSQREAEVIKRLVPEQQRKVVLAFDVNHETATDPELENYRFLHFATHSLLNSKHPELSGILLSLVDEQGRPQEPGILSLAEVYNLKLRADTVVLSACETALGKDVRGEGLIGLTRGFMYAGAARVLASLWKVDDQATAELMRLFYEGVLGEQRLRPADALRRAQVAMWRNPEWRAPHYWGGFILQGEWK